MELITYYDDLKKSDFVRRAAETYLVRMLVIGMGVVISVVVARVLGPEGRGLYAVAVSLGAIGVQFGSFGLHSSNIYYVSRDKKILAGLSANSLVVSFLVGGFGSLLAWFTFQTWPALAPINGTLLALSLLWIPFGLAYFLLQNLLIGLQDMRGFNKIELIGKALNLLLIALVFFGGFISVESFFSAGIVVIFFGMIFVLWVLSKGFKGPFRHSWKLFKGGFHYGFKAYLAAFFSFMVLRIDILMVKQMLGSEQTGFYSVAVNMADLVIVLPTIIGTLLFPKLAAMTDEKRKWEQVKRALRGVGFFMLLATLALVFVTHPLIKILFGKAFLPAVPAFLWLLPGVFMIALNTLLMNYFASTGMPWVTVYSPAFAALLNIGANLILIPRYGIVGASLSSVLAYGSMLAFSAVYILIVHRRDAKSQRKAVY